MTEANKESKKPADAEAKTHPANPAEQPEEWVRRKIVPPPEEPNQKNDGDRSPGGSGR